MDIVTLDFETYYDKDFSLKKMTTEAYIRHPMFQVIGVGVKINDHPTDWYSGNNVKQFLSSLDFSKCAMVCHNAAFDGAILNWHYNIKPKFWFDTLSMARPLHSVTVGGSLAALATYYGLGKKGDEVINAEGKRREDFTEQELARYAGYCINDVELTYKLFKKLKKDFPVSELMVIDQTIRMFTEPCLRLDTKLLGEYVDDIEQKKLDFLQSISGDIEGAKSVLMSNDKFAQLLKSIGVEPPTKTSPRTNKTTWAFAKTDKGMTDLLEHDDHRVRMLAAARLGTKSTIEQTRAAALVGIGERGTLPIMLNYYGAHTGRFSGGDKVNLQNLPARGNNKIRQAILAPNEYSKIIACDSSQIEARLVAWLAGQDDLVQAFREGRDVYSEFATEVYGRKITKTDKVERFVGKTCIAEGTLVLSDSGWKPIETVSLEDKLWDGKEWVCHQGLVNNGIKPTLSLCGTWLTPDHQVLSGTQWLEAQSVVSDEHILSQVLATGVENLPSQAISLAQEKELLHSLLSVNVMGLSTQSISITSKTLRALAVQFALKKHLLKNVTGYIAKQCQMTSIDVAYLIASVQRTLGVTPLQTAHTHTTVAEVSKYMTAGEKTKLHSCDMYKLLKDGIEPITKWIELMSMAITNRATYVSSHEAITYATKEKSLTLKPVYDILNCGSRNRFTILTEAGPIIVHNCILGLGYGMGAEKFRRTLEIGQGGINVVIDIYEAERIVRLYRQKNWKIVELWQRCGYALQGILTGGDGVVAKCVSYNRDGIVLPNNLKIVYPALRASNNGFEYVSDARAYRTYIQTKVNGDTPKGIKWTKIYGGKVTENIVQALAAIVIREQMAEIGQQYKVAFQVHDEIVITAGAASADHAEKELIRVMSKPPSWAADLPVACEAGQASNYGDV